MSDIAICAEGLSKRYQMGQQPYYTLRDSITAGLTWPLRMARRLKGDAPSDRPVEATADHIWALRDVTFDVREGERVGIIGVNGAGKSTLLKILSRVTEPTSGRALVRGRVSSLLEVGTGFHPELTGRENVYLNGTLLGMSRAEINGRFDEIVDFAGVEKFMDLPVKRYSSGMQLRLAFSVAAHLEPEIVLIDEVLAVGDARFQKNCIGKMEEIGKSGRTLLYVSHNLASVSNLCERAIILNAGKVVSDGPAENVIEEYIKLVSDPDQFHGGYAVWTDPATAPGNHIVRLHSIRVLQEGINGPTAEVDIAKDVEIEITYRNFKENARLYILLALLDQSGSLVFVSGNMRGMPRNSDAFTDADFKAGLYRSACRIPGYTLNDKRYALRVIVGERPNTEHVKTDFVSGFQVYDSGSMRQEFYAEWRGSVRPRLDWNTERVDGLGSAPMVSGKGAR